MSNYELAPLKKYPCWSYVGISCLVSLQVTSKNDQGQYWADSSKPYTYMSSFQIAEAFKNSRFGMSLSYTLSVPYDRQASHPSALAKTKYACMMREAFATCYDREIILIKRHQFLYIFRTCQVQIYLKLSFSYLTSYNVEIDCTK